MARYDWFLRCVNKVSSDKPSLISRTIYIPDKDCGVIEAVVMDARNGKVEYAIYSKDSSSKTTYGHTTYSAKNIDWFTNFEAAMRRAEYLMELVASGDEEE